jgi:mannosyl-3-phosphoglycerate phosphatase
MIKLLVFTDLDGSLLNHHDYSWKEAAPALKTLAENSFPVVINSSKTTTEINKLKLEIDNGYPHVSENGSIVSIPAGYFSPRNTDKKNNNGFEIEFFGRPYQEIINILSNFRNEYNFKFTGFYDMSIEELASTCNLSMEQAYDAKQREASEPLIWLDTEDAFARFKFLLEEKGLILVAGGRFYHVMADVDKAKALLWLKQKYQKDEPETQWLTVGLGDSFNDIRMLEVVDYPVLIPNPETNQPDLSYLCNLIQPGGSGPEGWNDAMLRIMNKIL